MTERSVVKKTAATHLRLAWMIILAWSPCAAGQEQRVPTYPVQSQLVQIFLTVTEGKQKITGLTESDFSITEDGLTKALHRLDNVEVPLQVALLLDTSMSMREALPLVQEAAVSFIDALRPEDRVTLIPFNSEIQVLPQLIDDPDPIKDAIRSTRSSGATRLYDALLLSMKHLAGKEGRKAVVLFSDGEDTGRGSSLGLVLNAAARYGYPIYTIGAGAGLERNTLKLVLRRLAEINSGKSYYVKDPGNLRDAFREVAGELRSAFLLNYYTQVPQDGRWHDVDIIVSNPRYKVHSRRGFYAQAGASGAGAVDMPDTAPRAVVVPAERVAVDTAGAERAARAASAEIMSVPLPPRAMAPRTISPDLPKPPDPLRTQPVFRVETRFIEVPVLLESVDGREIPQLSVKDFRVYEDGSRRQIACFDSDLTNENMTRIRDTAIQNIEALNPVRPVVPSSGDAEDAVLGKVFLFLDDLLTPAPQFLEAKKAAEKLIRDYHIPLRPVSLHFASESESDVSASLDRDALLAKLRRANPPLNKELTSNDDLMSVYEAYLIDRNEWEAPLLAELRLAASLNMSFENQLGSVRGIDVAGAGTAAGSAVMTEAGLRGQVENVARALVRTNEAGVSRLLDGLQATIEAAASDPGEYSRTVIMISSGFVLGFGDLRPRLRQVIDSARTRGIKIFTVDATGLAVHEELGIGASAGFLVQNPGLGRLLQQHESGWIHERESSLFAVATETGGRFLHGTNDLAGGAAGIVQTMGRLYYIGYLSDQPSDGRFHRIRVAAAAPHVRVQARRGYFADPRDDELAGGRSEGETEDWLALLDAANRALAAGDTAGLIAGLRKLARMFPRSVDLWYNLGTAWYQAGNFSEAARALQRALMLAPDDAGIGTALARAFLASGSHDAAVETTITMIQRHPGDVRLQFQLGRLYETAGSPADAYRIYRQALDQGFWVPMDLYPALIRTSQVLARRVEADIFIRDYLGAAAQCLILPPK